MRPFALLSPDDAVSAVAAFRLGAQFLAGGTTLLDLMKLDVMRPDLIVDLSGIAADHAGIEAGEQGLRLGALARMADVADHAAVRRDYPVIAQSLELAASPQLRNMATLGGNVLQRTRCNYFRDPGWARCNKRNPGSGCAALDGVNRKHAVLGVSDHCIAGYPGDLGQALIALDATVVVAGAHGPRTIAFADLHREPGDDPQIEANLRPGDLILAFYVPAGGWTRRSLYLKIRDRQSYEFALASAAVAMDLRDGKIEEVRIGLGGVSARPWRAREAESALAGKAPSGQNFRIAAELAFADARPREGNSYKVALGKRTLARALAQAATMQV